MLPLYIVTIMAIGGILLLVVLSHHRTMKLTSYTRGKVIEALEQETARGEERAWETKVVCEYKAGGKVRRAEKTLLGRQGARYPAGKEVGVRYNPAEPDIGEVQ